MAEDPGKHLDAKLDVILRAVLNPGPYAQRKTLRQQACEIDLLNRHSQAPASLSPASA